MCAWFNKKSDDKKPKTESGPPDLVDALAGAASQSFKQPPGYEELLEVFYKIPAIKNDQIYWGYDRSSGIWWVSFHIDIRHKDAFLTIQHLGYELNWYTASIFGSTGGFYPESPPPQAQNAGPEVYLQWKIDSWGGKVTPSEVAKALDMVVYYLGGEQKN